MATTFRKLYEDPKSDPFSGSYAEPLEMYVAPPSSSNKAWPAKDIYLKTFFVDPSYANAYVRLFEDAKGTTEATRLLHAPTRYSTVFGHQNDYEFGGYALLDDVAGGTIQVVEYTDAVFKCTKEFCVHVSGTVAFDTWIINPDAEVLPPPTAGSRTRTVRVPKLMYVPPKYISLFGKRLAPRELLEEVYPALVEEEQVEDMEPLIRRMIACGILVSSDDKALPCYCLNHCANWGHSLPQVETNLHLPTVAKTPDENRPSRLDTT
jgi:hypothetical protein